MGRMEVVLEKWIKFFPKRKKKKAALELQYKQNLHETGGGEKEIESAFTILKHVLAIYILK